MKRLILLIVIAATLWQGRNSSWMKPILGHVTPATSSTWAATRSDRRDFPPTPQYQCDGRTYCSQMHSCAEATWFLQHCPGTKMDGNHDGVPCEMQWCH